MSEWKTLHISDIGKIVTGKTPRTSIETNYGGSIPFLTPSDDLSGKFVPQTNKTITEQGLSEVRNCLLPPNSICVSCIGSDLGKVVKTTRPLVTNQQFNSIIPNNDEFDSDFVYYLMLTVGKRLNYIGKTSTAVPIVNKTHFSNFEVNVPSLEQQRLIANILSSLDNKIEVNRRINDNLEKQAQALYKQWFVNKRQKEWNMGVVSDYYDITIGKTPPRKEKQWFSFNEKDRVWVSISDMGTCGIFINNSSEYLTSEAISKFNVKIVPNNTVLLSFKLTVGRVAISDGIMTTNEAIAHFNTDKEYLLEYTYLALKAYEFSNLGSTSSIATAVNSKIIKTMSWMMPDDATLYKFHDLTSPIFIKIKNNIRENQKLITLRDTLLPKLMSGELSVNDVLVD